MNTALVIIGSSPFLFADGLMVIRIVGFFIVVIACIVSAICGYRSIRPINESLERLHGEWKGKSRYPVSVNCPSCGSTEYEKAKDQKDQLVIVHDRICNACEARYTPPAPAAASFTAIVSGCLLIPVSIVGAICFGQLKSHVHSTRWVDVLFPVLALFGVPIGIYLIFFGIAKLRMLKSRKP